MDFTTEAAVGRAVPVSMDNSVRKLMDTVQMGVGKTINNRCVKVYKAMYTHNSAILNHNKGFVIYVICFQVSVYVCVCICLLLFICNQCYVHLW